jgi:FixJ family two-component response regulator
MTLPPPASHRTYTILLVDDDATFRRSQKRLLSAPSRSDPSVSFDISEADCGESAMGRLSQGPVDCVLLDYSMPGGDGNRWLLRFLEQIPNLAIIVVTGSGNEQVAAESMRQGAMDYLVKGTIDRSSLERAILNSVTKIEMRKLIETQRKELMEAEKYRVMIASLGAARHHLGQPACVITIYLDLMKKKETDPVLRGNDPSMRSRRGHSGRHPETTGGSVAISNRTLFTRTALRTPPRADSEILAI